MNTLLKPAPAGAIVYPESDGEPMADNSKQLRWIVVLYGNLSAWYRDAADVFVGGNQNWFPREGEPELYKAPDVYVVFGRPKGDRRSWQQWLEGGVPMTVVFEILSPKNTHFEMADKLQFYDEYGVEEYYVYDPDANSLLAYARGQAALRLVRFKGEYTSPRLGARFDLTGPEMVVYRPDGHRFLTFEELEAERASQAQLRQAAEEKLQAAEKKRQAAEEQRQIAEKRLRRVTELGRKARQGQATPEEVAELERLEDEADPPAP
jgi:Uma2 family endonuclease